MAKTHKVARRELVALVVGSESTIVNALRVLARNMAEAADGAQAAFEAGHSDGLVTNNGYKQSAVLFREQSEKAKKVADDLEERIQSYQDADDEDSSYASNLD